MISVITLTKPLGMRILVSLLLAVLVGCAAPSAGEAQQGAVPEMLLASVREDLQDRVGKVEFRLLKAQAVTWRSGALGCPEPGMAYTQALVEGYHVVYEAAGKSWDYRLNQRGYFRLCK